MDEWVEGNKKRHNEHMEKQAKEQAIKDKEEAEEAAKEAAGIQAFRDKKAREEADSDARYENARNKPDMILKADCEWDTAKVRDYRDKIQELEKDNANLTYKNKEYEKELALAKK